MPVRLPQGSNSPVFSFSTPKGAFGAPANRATISPSASISSEKESFAAIVNLGDEAASLKAAVR